MSRAAAVTKPKPGEIVRPKKGGAPRKLAPAKVAETLRAKGGNVTQTADALGVRRMTIADYVASFPDCAQAVVDGREALVDLAESTLAREMRAGNVTAAIFVAKTLGRERGFVERHEQTGPGGGPRRVDVTVTLKRDGVPPLLVGYRPLDDEP